MIQLVKERIGLRRDASGYSLFEVFGTLERNMLPNEKVADAMFKWEKYARTTNSPKTLKLTFKVCTSYVYRIEHTECSAKTLLKGTE